MIGGIPHASAFPKSPSLIAKEEPKPFAEKIAEKKEEKELRERGTSAPNQNSRQVLDRPPATSPIRYGVAPSAIDRKVDTGLNTTGLRQYEPETKPQGTQKLEEARGDRRVDQLDESTSKRNRMSGIMTRSPRDPSEVTPTVNLEGTEHRTPAEFAHAASAPLYEQLKREYIQKQDETRSSGTVLNEKA
jgi:hypothetical protein